MTPAESRLVSAVLALDDARKSQRGEAWPRRPDDDGAPLVKVARIDYETALVLVRRERERTQA